ncbi:MAG: hypothetical protein QW563_00720, partial [Candidatus Methanomethylicia archaeon]
LYKIWEIIVEISIIIVFNEKHEKANIKPQSFSKHLKHYSAEVSLRLIGLLYIELQHLIMLKSLKKM